MPLNKFLESTVKVDKTTALKVLESLPEPMQPTLLKNGAGILESPTYLFLHKLFKDYVDKFNQEYNEMYNGLTLKTAYGFWLKMYGASVNIAPISGETIENQYTSDETVVVEVDEIVKVVLGHSAGGAELHYYKRLNTQLPLTDLSTIDFTSLDWQDVTTYDEPEATFKARIINEIFKNKVSNIAIKDALQPFSSTEVFVLDKLGASASSSIGIQTIPSELPFLSYDEQEIYTSLSSDIDSSVLTIQLDDTSFFPDSGVIQIGQEYMLYSSKDSSNIYVEERGYAETSAAPHYATNRVYYATRFFNMFLDAFNVLGGLTTDADGNPAVSGAFEFDIYITPYPNTDNTIKTITNIVNSFKASGTKFNLKIGLPYSG